MVSTTLAYNDSRSIARAGLGYDGVVYISNGKSYGTGVLLSDGRHILTAAHLAYGISLNAYSVYFQTAAGTSKFAVSCDQVDGNYDAINDNGDLALLTLATPAPVAAERYALYRQTDELGQVGTLVGYGAAATGAGGIVANDLTTVRRMGENRLDATFDQLAARYGNEMAWHPAVGAQLAADFDNGVSANDGLGRLLGLTDLGLGDQEALISPGDSGGPLFLQKNKIAGIASYSVRLDVAMSSPDIDSISNSSFGEFAAWQRVSFYQQWIDQRLRADYAGAPAQPAEVQKTVLEGNGGTVITWFLVTLSHPAVGGEQIQFHTSDGSAKAGVDYLPVADTLKFYAGEDHIAIPVEVIGNMRTDGNRNFSLVVTDPVGGVFAGGVSELTASRTIVDDDGPALMVGIADPVIQPI